LVNEVKRWIIHRDICPPLSSHNGGRAAEGWRAPAASAVVHRSQL